MVKKSGKSPQTPRFNCPQCSKTFKTDGANRRHVNSVHNQIKRYFCTICDRGFYAKAHCTDHEQTHNSETVRLRWPCTECTKIYTCKRSLQGHLKLVHAKNPTSFRCTFCQNITFTNNRSLNYHIALIHTLERPYQCDKCPYKTHSLKLLKRHKKAHEDRFMESHKCPQCNKGFRDSTHRREHIERVHEKIKRFFCTVCKRGFYDKFYLNDHQSTHISRNLKCSFCSETFKTVKNLNGHIQRIHTKELTYYSCYFCEKSHISNRTLLRYHILQNHTLERPYPCDECPFKTVCLRNLKSHQNNVHSSFTKDQITFFKCPVPSCSITFTTRAIMNGHIRLAHEELLNFYCFICSRRFRYQSTLKWHLKFHG